METKYLTYNIRWEASEIIYKVKLKQLYIFLWSIIKLKIKKLSNKGIQVLILWVGVQIYMCTLEDNLAIKANVWNTHISGPIKTVARCKGFQDTFFHGSPNNEANL